ncbi:carnitine O-acetyltransferase isoform X2 [Anabrus simplex]
MLKLISLVKPSPRLGAFLPESIGKQTDVFSRFRLPTNRKPNIGWRLLSTESGLLRQPVPPLQHTLEKYLRTVKPLITDDEFCITQDIVKNFGSPGGVGEKLQKLLEERAKTTDNWLAEWWLNTAYLDFRWPVVVYSSPGLVFPLQNYKTQDEQIKLAAKVILAALDYKKLIDENKLPQEKMGKDLLDMSQYSKIMGTCRIPGETRDSLSYLDPHSPPKHVVVAYKNQFFEVPVLGNKMETLSEEQVVTQLCEVMSSSPPPSPPVGVLTTENRNTWGKAYKALTKDSQNLCSLTSLEKCLFLVCLDDPNPSLGSLNRQTVAALQMVHGCGSKSNSANRWFDKTIQFIIGSDGELGLTYEHSPAEGPPIANLMDHIMKQLDKGGVKPAGASEFAKPKHLPFNVPTKILDTIETAKTNIDCLVDDLDMSCFTYKGYGKEFPKAQKLSPDSFIQMAMQLAFYRIHKEPAAHYESASCRKFLNGRTETIRSCSSESVAFAKAMLDSSKSDQDKVAALRTAISGHKEYSLQAVNGLGVDRHLLGLKLIGIENGMDVPKLFLDAGFIRSSHMRISSSQVAANCDGFMCYGPLVPDGYGCCYNPRANEIILGVSAFNSSPETSALKFREALEQSFNDMHDVLLKVSTKAKL